MVVRETYIHPDADVSPEAVVGDGTCIWRNAHIREEAQIGELCNIGKGVYVDARVRIGSCVKIQNNVSVFEGVTLEDGVFVGPHVCFTNDLYPRAINADGTLKSASDWEITPTVVKHGASIGAGAIILCGVTIGEFALIGAGSVVTRDVLPYALVLGNPARPQSFVCRCARPFTKLYEEDNTLTGWCEVCEKEYRIR